MPEQFERVSTLEEWAKSLDDGLADLREGRLVAGAVVLAEIDEALSEMEAGERREDGKALAVGPAAGRGARR